ncbi:MAG: hypothetical protein ACREDJ_01255 [Methylocella sp.]
MRLAEAGAAAIWRIRARGSLVTQDRSAASIRLGRKCPKGQPRACSRDGERELSVMRCGFPPPLKFGNAFWALESFRFAAEP